MQPSCLHHVHRRYLTKLSAAERAQLASLVRAYVQRPGVLKAHQDWHTSNGSGGTTGPGSGERFLAFHRNYIGGLEDWIKTQVTEPGKLKKFVPMPRWKPSTRIPAEFSHPGRDTDNPKIKTPTWLSAKGGKTPSPRFKRKRLGEFTTSDELGREIGLSFHGTVHNTVGGDLATTDSPKDPIFFAWHGYLDDIWTTWETT